MQNQIPSLLASNEKSERDIPPQKKPVLTENSPRLLIENISNLHKDWGNLYLKKAKLKLEDKKKEDFSPEKRMLTNSGRF